MIFVTVKENSVYYKEIQEDNFRTLIRSFEYLLCYCGVLKHSSKVKKVFLFPIENMTKKEVK